MLHRLVAMRGLMAMGLAAAVGRVGTARASGRHGRSVSGVIEARSPGVSLRWCTGTPRCGSRTPFFAASLVLSLLAIVGVSPRPARPCHARCRRIPQPENRPAPTLVLGETHFDEHCRARADARVADDPAARALHGRDDARRRRHREDVGVHVSLRRPIAPLARGRSRPQDRRPGAGSEGRLLPAGAARFSRRQDASDDYVEIGLDSGSATTRCTTISTRTPSRTPSPRS